MSKQSTYVRHCIFLFLIWPYAVQANKILTPLNGWFKVACIAENLKASSTYVCDDKGFLQCLPGWTDESKFCKTPICQVDGHDCVNGNCTAPYTCTCEVGWFGEFCENCVRLPGCLNGYCNTSLECTCEDGWEGMLCDKPTCGPCVHGHCSAPGICSCHPGWSGPDCSICAERPDCHYGRCVNAPFECVCFDGYSGSSCDKPTCSQGCHPEYGFCSSPEQCQCEPGWQGLTCSQCVPYWNCVNGYCEEPWECICNPGFVGPNCNATGDQDGNWGSWGPWSSCSVTCSSGSEAGFERRSRPCNDPPPSGNGKYCSKDGSSGSETRPCTPAVPPCTPTTPVPNPDRGNWGEWSAFTPCSVTCGPGGTQTRTRLCNNPPPSPNSPFDCEDDGESGTETRNCNSNTCPIDGGFTQWTAFSPCTAICVDDTGDRVRRRFCTNPEPQFGGLDCQGPDRQEIPCTGDIPRQTVDPTSDCFNFV